tara:strand:+ start:142 stop:861 length:720 start_codon:yes stop_codon:yes gene_type:complete
MANKKKKVNGINYDTTHFTMIQMPRDKLFGIGGSDATKIVEGKWKELWEIKTGQKPYENLDDVLAVQMGIWTEDMNRLWFSKLTGKKILVPDIILSKEVRFAYASLDGITNDGCVFEAKHCSPFTIKNVTDKYYPQIQHYLMVTRFDKAYLSVFIGNSGHKIFEIQRDDKFIFKLLYGEAFFWNYVEQGIEPPDYVDFDEFINQALSKLKTTSLPIVLKKGKDKNEWLPKPSWISKSIH